ncbi:hypothetical protein [Marivirga sp.]|uniref:hypothetical protein n=1 Tax=Marivirga sp. TaxID=2018662 RepID=UPI002D7FAF36|nr:hypothetical protein [Marivirga sp.]
MARKLIVFIILILLLFVLLVPRQEDYFQRIAADYGTIHKSSELSSDALKKLGQFEYHNRLFYSQFEYQFGNISVSYFGILSFIIFEKSEFKEPQSPQITV